MDHDYLDDSLVGFVPKAYAPLWGPRSNAMWKAVLSAVLPPEQRGDILSRQMHWLREAWHRRLGQLKDLGHPGLQDGQLRFQYVRNCPPFGCRLIREAKPCGFRWCPFCWARDTVATLHDILSRAELPPYVYRFDETITELLTKGFWSGSTWYEPGGLAEAVAAHRVCGPTGPLTVGVIRRRRYDLLGGWLQLAPTMTADRATLRRRGIVLSGTPLEIPPNCTWERIPVVDGRIAKKTLPRVVAAAARYHGWWLRGDPEWVLHVLQELPQVRLTVTYGRLRGIPRGPRPSP